MDVLDNDITAIFEPDRLEVRATHRMRVRLLSPASTLRLRLHDDFVVSSVTSDDGGSLLFFRVRDQGNIVVSLGPLSLKKEPFTLTTRYQGRHDPAPVDQEILQVGPATDVTLGEEGFVDRPPLVYSNRTAWYPRPTSEDHATARVGIETPAGWLGVTGGELVSIRTEEGRTRSEFRLEPPGKFVTAIVGRLTDVGLRQEGVQAVRGFAAPAHPRRDPRPDARRAAGAGLLRGEVRAAGVPDARPRGRGGPDARRAQPARPAVPAGAAAGPARALAARRSRELQRPAGLLPRARGGAPVVGPGHRARQLPRAVAIRGLGPVRGRAVGARAARRARLPRDDGPDGRVGPPVRLRRPDPPRAAPRAPPAGPAGLPRGRLRQGRVVSAHAARARGRPGVLLRRARLPGALSLREGRHRGPAPGAGRRERTRPAAVLRAVDLRHGPRWRSPGRRAPRRRAGIPDDGPRSGGKACPGRCRCRSRSRPPAGGRRSP